MQKPATTPTPLPASIYRRYGAWVYDGFIVFSVLLLLTAIALLLNRGEDLMPFRWLYLSYLFLCTGLFLSSFWCRSGQTLGMLAWKIKVVDQHYQTLTWQHAFYRYFISLLTTLCGGIGLLWCFIDKEKQSLHDRIAGTKVIEYALTKKPRL